MSVRSSLACLFLVALGSGCRIFAREEYSMVIRKPAHRYREPMPAEEHEPPVSDSLPPPEVRSPPSSAGLEPFHPFAYCHLHRSSHGAESIVAVLLAPAELPLALAVDTGADVTLALARELRSWWTVLFSKDSPEVPDSREGPR